MNWFAHVHTPRSPTSIAREIYAWPHTTYVKVVQHSEGYVRVYMQTARAQLRDDNLEQAVWHRHINQGQTLKAHVAAWLQSMDPSPATAECGERRKQGIASHRAVQLKEHRRVPDGKKELKDRIRRFEDGIRAMQNKMREMTADLEKHEKEQKKKSSQDSSD